jgi:hypothetical protein
MWPSSLYVEPIQGWGSKKSKKDSKTFVGLLLENNIYLKKL